jgi:unsaturated rhamnogalacturonyl hydrolase
MNAQGQTISKKMVGANGFVNHDATQRIYMIDDAITPKWDYVHGLVLTSFDELNKNIKPKNTVK